MSKKHKNQAKKENHGKGAKEEGRSVGTRKSRRTWQTPEYKQHITAYQDMIITTITH
jgi:hypothetical protein